MKRPRGKCSLCGTNCACRLKRNMLVGVRSTEPPDPLAYRGVYMDGWVPIKHSHLGCMDGHREPAIPFIRTRPYDKGPIIPFDTNKIGWCSVPDCQDKGYWCPTLLAHLCAEHRERLRYNRLERLGTGTRYGCSRCRKGTSHD